jgi:hypothetical protein
MTARHSVCLSIELKDMFWNYDFRRLEWCKDRELIISRISNRGGLSALTWLRANMSDNELREWIMLRSGTGISPQRLRFREAILNLPHRKVNAWLKSDRRSILDRRFVH